MAYRDLLDAIKKELPAKIYILTASDRFLHAEAARLVRGLVPPAERDFNFQSFDLLSSEKDKVSFDQILDVMNTVPFFAGRKYVLIENFQKAAKKDMKKIADYLLNPSESTALVLLHEGSLKKDAKEVLKGVKQIVLDIREGEIPAWISATARLKGLNVSRAAAEYLFAVIGPDLGMISTEIEKLQLLGKTSIETEDIREIIEGKRTYGAFDLIHALRARDTETTFAIYGVLRETEEAFSLLGALNWHYAQMLNENNSPAEKDYLYSVFRLLNRADMGIKTGGFYPLELLLVELLRLSVPR
jgi:DNA polymerase III delta subunit